jgi:predicted  nucleic acid-binding Zn-ribbon protein
VQEKRLQDQMDNSNLQTEDFNNVLNKALHTMTAHLHRYGSELERLADIVEHVKWQHQGFFANRSDKDAHPTVEAETQRTQLGIIQISSQLEAVNSFRQELEDKTKNILALVFLRTNVRRDGMASDDQ